MYTAATDLPNLNFAQWSQPTSANPRLATPISATDTTIVVTSAPKDHTDTVITGNFLMGIKNSAGYTETIYVPVGSSSDGITFTSVIRGVWLEGIDYTTSDTTSKAVAFDQDSPVYFNVSPVIEKLVFAALLGTIGSTYKLNARPTYSGTNAIHGERIFANTTARDAAITAPQNGDTCYVTADGVFYDYQGGAWASRATGSTPNASTTVAGKVEIATQAENDAGTTTGGTGALLTPTPNLTAKSVQDAKWVYAASSGGTDTYAITLVPAPAAYVTGMTIHFFADVANTGAATLNVNSLGAKAINKLAAGAAATLENNDIIAGFVYSVTYNGTYFVLDNPVANTMTSANKATLTGGTSSDADSLHVHYNTGIAVVASDNLKASADTERKQQSTITKVKEIRIQKGGTVRVKFDMKTDSAGAGTGRIYRNGVAYGTNQTTNSTTYVTFSEDLVFYPGDLIQLWVGGSNPQYGYVSNFRIYYDIATVAAITVITD